VSARSPTRVLCLEDDAVAAELLRRVLEREGFDAVTVTSQRETFLAELAAGPDVVVSDHEVPGYPGLSALADVRARAPETPFVFLCGAAERGRVLAAFEAGADDFVTKDQVFRLPGLLLRFVERTARRHAEQRLVAAVRELSHARTIEDVAAVVRATARALVGADGATFVLRDGDQCHYFDEDAIGPLWKGRRFPAETCISGWAMVHGETAVIPDIYGDPRIPADAYRPTFVKSLVMVPVRREAPMAAIGTYWATRHAASEREVEVLQALADSTAVAMENVRVYGELEARVRARTAELAAANEELEAFSYAVSHDLRNPLGQIRGFVEILAEDLTDPPTVRTLELVLRATRDMGALIDDLLRLGQTSRQEVHEDEVDLSALAERVRQSLTPRADLEVHVEPGLVARGDAGLLAVLLQNLLANAWKFTARTTMGRIRVGGLVPVDGERTFFVRDNGAGFDPAKASRLFAPFVRLHAAEAFRGTGVGLATCRRVVQRHRGRIWAEAAVDAGATFYFTLPVR